MNIPLFIWFFVQKYHSCIASPAPTHTRLKIFQVALLLGTYSFIKIKKWLIFLATLLLCRAKWGLFILFSMHMYGGEGGLVILGA